MSDKKKIEDAIFELSYPLRDAEGRLYGVHRSFGDLAAREKLKYSPSFVADEKKRLERRAAFYENKPNYQKQLEETLSALSTLSTLPVATPVVWPKSLLKKRAEIEKEIESIKERIAKLKSYV